MESVILEANRLRSIDQNADTSIDEFNNRWTNSVSTTGIEVKAGDIVSIESAAINAKGNEVEDTMEFRGETDAGFTDNTTKLKFNYYICNTGDFTIPLPMREDLTYNGVNLTGSGHEDNYLVVNAINLRTRQLGEWDPQNVPINPASQGLTPTQPPQDYKTNPIFQFFYPLTGNTNAIKGGYTEGEICELYFPITAAPHIVDTGITIRVLTTKSEGTTTGIIDTWELDNITGLDNFGGVPFPQYYVLSLAGRTAPQSEYYISNIAHPFTPASNSKIGIVLKNPKTFTKRTEEPDGTRYYKGKSNFLGWGLNNCAGIAASAGLTYPEPTAGFTARSLNNIANDFTTYGDGNFTSWEVEATEVELSIPTGFSTPTDVANTLTDQLHSPQIITNQNPGDFVSTDRYDFEKAGVFTATSFIAPTMVSTPTFKPIPAGFSIEAQQPPISNFSSANGDLEATYQDQYRIWYNSVYWEDYKRVEALGFFRQFFYGVDNTDINNEINSGDDQQPNAGDFKNQEIGELGLLPRLLSSFGQVAVPATSNSPAYNVATSNNQRFYPLRTNIRYTKDIVERIGRAFKKCEENRGTHNGLPVSAGGVLPNTPIGDPSKVDTTNMAVLLDIGMYVDEKSQPGQLNNPDTRVYLGPFTSGGTTTDSQFQGQEGFITTFLKDQRQQWAIPSELGAAVHTYVSTTKTSSTLGGTTDNGRNALFDARTFQMADGQELPQIWVQSRWREGLQARQMTPDRDTNLPSFSDAVEDLMDFNTNTTLAPDMPYLNGYNAQDFTSRFERDFTDPITGVVYKYKDYIQWAIDADVALMPYFAEEGDIPYGNVPYVAFLCFDRIGNNVGGGDFFPTRPQVIEMDLVKPQQFIGFDCSFTRNKAVFFQNTQNRNAMETSRYSPNAYGINQTENFEATPYGMIGAVNANFNFDAIKSRFEIKGLSTPLTIGNPFTNFPVFGTKTANDNPEQQIFSVSRGGAAYFIYTDNFGNPATYVATSTYGGKMIQKEGTIMDSYSGISLQSIILTNANTGAETEISEYSKLNEFNFVNSLLNKMGFELAQLLPPFGDTQARFDNALFKDPLNQTLLNTPRIVKPFTTGAFISSAEYQPTATDFNRFPLYSLGTAQDIQAEPQVSSASLVAKNLPGKLDFPYLMIYTNLGLEMLYYGGNDAHSRLPCLAYISRNYSAGDFFYLPAGTFNLQVSRDFVLTDITTDIRLPDGSRPRLSPHSSVIYKIIRAPPTPPTAQQEEQKSNEEHKKMLLNVA